jgi:hypothetical protein
MATKVFATGWSPIQKMSVAHYFRDVICCFAFLAYDLDWREVRISCDPSNTRSIIRGAAVAHGRSERRKPGLTRHENRDSN